MSDSTKQTDILAFRTVAALLVALVLSNVFASAFVGSERYVYFWDWSGYWIQFRDLAAKLLAQPLQAIRESISSVRSADYNILPVAPLVPIAWIFGGGRATYVLGIVNLYLFAGAVLLGLVMSRIVGLCEPKNRSVALIAGTGVALLFHATWIPALRGLPDVIGVGLIATVLLVAFGARASEAQWKTAVLIGLLVCALVLMALDARRRGRSRSAIRRRQLAIDSFVPVRCLVVSRQYRDQQPIKRPQARQDQLVVLLEQQRAHQASDRALVREDANDVGATLDLAIQSLEHVRAVDLHPVYRYHRGTGPDG